MQIRNARIYTVNPCKHQPYIRYFCLIDPYIRLKQKELKKKEEQTKKKEKEKTQRKKKR